jgi:hypothetical protein
MEDKLRRTAHNNTSCFTPRAAYFSLSLFVLRFVLTAFFCLSGTAFLCGQEPGYRIEEDGHFVQLLKWEPQESVLYYEVEVEKQTGETWEGALKEQTEEPFFEFSLAPGTYRYRARAYDFLERPGLASDWIQFAIFPALQPELFRFSPDRFYLDEDPAWVITLSGRNLVEGLEVFLEDSQGNRILPDTVTVGPPGNEARLSFNYEQLDTGVYAIHVTNPGGLSAGIQNFGIVFRKPVDINLAAGYRPLVPLYGHINQLVGAAFFPIGAYSRLSIIPIKQRWGYVGLELEPSWSRILAAGDIYDIEAQLPGAAIYGLYRLWLAKRTLALDVRIGGGLYAFLDYHVAFARGSADSITVLAPALAAGAALQWLVKRPFFVEAGFTVSHFLTVDDPSPGYLTPFAGLGWQF